MNRTSANVAGDVLVVGGGAAGLTSALVLARARHGVTVVDGQTHRNATVDEFHGFPTRDATAPNRFRADARDELDSYDVAIVRSKVLSARSMDTSVDDSGGRHHDPRRCSRARHRRGRRTLAARRSR